MDSALISVIETKAYLSKAKILTEAERNEVVDLVATDPECDDLIPEGGGIRKAGKWEAV